MNFWDKKIEKSNFYKTEKLFKIDGIDVNKIIVSKREAFSKYQINTLLGMMTMRQWSCDTTMFKASSNDWIC